MKKILWLAIVSCIMATSAMAQGAAPSDSRDRYDRSTAQAVPSGRMDSQNTGTMPDKSMGPGATTGTDRGPDGTPGKGSPAKTTGGQQ